MSPCAARLVTKVSAHDEAMCSHLQALDQIETALQSKRLRKIAFNELFRWDSKPSVIDVGAVHADNIVDAAIGPFLYQMPRPHPTSSTLPT